MIWWSLFRLNTTASLLPFPEPCVSRGTCLEFAYWIASRCIQSHLGSKHPSSGLFHGVPLGFKYRKSLPLPLSLLFSLGVFVCPNHVELLGLKWRQTKNHGFQIRLFTVCWWLFIPSRLICSFWFLFFISLPRPWTLRCQSLSIWTRAFNTWPWYQWRGPRIDHDSATQ